MYDKKDKIVKKFQNFVRKELKIENLKMTITLILRDYQNTP